MVKKKDKYEVIPGINKMQLKIKRLSPPVVRNENLRNCIIKKLGENVGEVQKNVLLEIADKNEQLQLKTRECERLVVKNTELKEENVILRREKDALQEKVSGLGTRNAELLEEFLNESRYVSDLEKVLASYKSEKTPTDVDKTENEEMSTFQQNQKHGPKLTDDGPNKMKVKIKLLEDKEVKLNNTIANLNTRIELMTESHQTDKSYWLKEMKNNKITERKLAKRALLYKHKLKEIGEATRLSEKTESSVKAMETKLEETNSVTKAEKEQEVTDIKTIVKYDETQENKDENDESREKKKNSFDHIKGLHGESNTKEIEDELKAMIELHTEKSPAKISSKWSVNEALKENDRIGGTDRNQIAKSSSCPRSSLGRNLNSSRKHLSYHSQKSKINPHRFPSNNSFNQDHRRRKFLSRTTNKHGRSASPTRNTVEKEWQKSVRLQDISSIYQKQHPIRNWSPVRYFSGEEFDSPNRFQSRSSAIPYPRSNTRPARNEWRHKLKDPEFQSHSLIIENSGENRSPRRNVLTREVEGWMRFRSKSPIHPFRRRDTYPTRNSRAIKEEYDRFDTLGREWPIIQNH